MARAAIELRRASSWQPVFTWFNNNTIKLRAEHLDESLCGADSPNIMTQLWTLCDMHDKRGKPDKAEPYYAHALSIGEKAFGENNPQIVPSSQPMRLNCVRSAKPPMLIN